MIPFAGFRSPIQKEVPVCTWDTEKGVTVTDIHTVLEGTGGGPADWLGVVREAQWGINERGLQGPVKIELKGEEEDGISSREITWHLPP